MADRAGLLRSYLDKGQIAGAKIDPRVRKSLEPLALPRNRSAAKVQIPPKAASKTPFRPARPLPDPVRWNKDFPHEFDVAATPSRPSNVIWDWVSRHVGVEVKKLYQNSTCIPSARLGSFLTGLKHVLAPHSVDDVRNVNGDGTERPPDYRVIPLNSKSKADFLIDGMAFYRGALGKFVVEYRPDWSGECVTVYCALDRRQIATDVIEKSWEWARENNFLKGEAFTLGGEFLERTVENWNEVFLEDQNKAPLLRTISLFNTKQKAFPNRGMIFSGPPGTGKTLSSRIIKNQAKGTFIWVSSRDFHMAGSFGGFSYAFDMAKELAPAILCFEDVDNWLHDRTVDLIKTEMDGISRGSGILTILTTNFPERIPEALIDRPGRFHDVLHFALPTEKARRDMLAKWMPEVAQADRDFAVRGTDGYSGAHVYELAQFAKSLREHDGMDAPTALREALRKVEEQRELITAVQLQGSHYRPRKEQRRIMTKALNESGGATGGYTVKPDANALAAQTAAIEPERGATPDHEAIKAAGCGVMEGTAEGAKGMGHALHYKADPPTLWHEHDKDADPNHLQTVRGQLEGIPGVESVEQATASPGGEGWEQIHGGAKPIGPAETQPTAQPAGEEGQQKAFARKAAVIAATYRSWPKYVRRTWLAAMRKKTKAALLPCINATVKKLTDEGYPKDQAECVAYSTCRKDLEDPAEMDMEEGEESAKVPAGVSLWQHVCEMIEAELPAMEPENAEVAEMLLEEIRSHAGERYPEHEFGGGEKEEKPETEPETNADKPEADAEAEDALAAYMTPPKKSLGKLAQFGRLKRMAKRHHGVIKDATEHMGDMADKVPGDPFTRTDKSACKLHHGAMMKCLKEMGEGAAGEEEEGEVKSKAPDLADMIAEMVTKEAGGLRSDLRKTAYSVTGQERFRTVGA